MLDVEFTDRIAAALSRAVYASRGGEKTLADGSPEEVRRLCRRAAWELLFDLDGQSLLDLALAKISAEQTLLHEHAA